MQNRKNINELNNEYVFLSKNYFSLLFKFNKLKMIIGMIVFPFFFFISIMLLAYFKEFQLSELIESYGSYTYYLFLISIFVFFYYFLSFAYIPYYSFFKYVKQKNDIKDVNQSFNINEKMNELMMQAKESLKS